MLLVIVAAVLTLALAGLPTYGRGWGPRNQRSVGLGVMLASGSSSGSGNNGLVTIESTHSSRVRLVLVPALAAVAAAHHAPRDGRRGPR